ncbi:ScbA/BarX family gamma-butyrolactone biosynthesis protein [Kitasatospora sp. NPDC059646]|uniref:ScbA/BarX family gamma-butyrolactone biosynthesis protein n=1 Tax=Kitasatospora sp. NPDC059646 TaxID=3346893 RepID=UPI0036863982
MTTSTVAPSHRTPARGLSFSSLMSPDAVHKSAAGEVFLTDALRLAEDHVAVAARWHRDRFLPGAGARPGPAAGAADPLLVVETARQSLIHLSHAFYGAPRDHPFVLNTLELELSSGAPAAPAPRPVLLDITCTRNARTPRRQAMTLDATVLADGAALARVRMRWEILDPRLYALARTRARQDALAAARTPEALAPRRLAAHEAGCAQQRDVVLARTPEDAPGAFRLDVDTTHPVLYDHPCDHTPGMVLLEAFLQAATAAAPPGAAARSGLTRLAATFNAFGEPDAPVLLTAEPGAAAGLRTTRLTAAQGPTALATAQLTHLPRVPAARRGAPRPTVPFQVGR